MDADQNPQPVCAQEALNLLNCATETPYDPEKCARLLESLHQCILNKKVKKFSLAEQSEVKPDTNQREEKLT